MKGKIAEIFSSIQGEGLYLGDKQIFVRFFGCNLSCKFCDTRLSSFKEYDAQELFQAINNKKNGYHSVSFTGGEPLLQKGFLKDILMLTKKSGLKNYLETNGTLADELQDVIDYVDVVAMDLKLPTSSGMKNFWSAHRRFLPIASQKTCFLKAVICHSTKEKDLKEIIKLLRDTRQCVTLVLQPNSAERDTRLMLKIEKFRDMLVNNNVATCIIPQFHKIIGVN